MADGIDTLPAGVPALTIGWHVMAWGAQNLRQPNGPRAGKLWQPTARQIRFRLWFYALDENGRWLFQRGIRRLAKGSGKSPDAAVMSLTELLGPVRIDVDRWLDAGGDQAAIDMVGRDGTPEFVKPVDMALVQIAATAESQTANTMRVVAAMAQKRGELANRYHLDPGKTVIYGPNGGELRVITSSASAAEGSPSTFIVADETEHWTPATGGQDLAQTLKRNLAKLSNRMVETANAWEPGAGSVAESTFTAWQAQQEGRTQGDGRYLYDALIAPADTDLKDEKSMTSALSFVYSDCPWVDEKTILDTAWDGETTADVVRRFYLNQPTAAEDAWVTPMEWAALTAELVEGVEGPVRRIQDGEDVVLFFDGSKSRDATGLVGCAMSDGHIFTVGGWEPSGDDEVPAHEVDAWVAQAFKRWSVVAFFADVREWESFVKLSWPEAYGDDLLIHASRTGKEPQAIAWDMRSKSFDFTAATELAHTELVEKTFTHDGHPMLSRHVEHARNRKNHYGITIGKESKDSSKKIDLAVCMIGARMVRRLVLASDAWKKRQRRGEGGPNRVILL